MSNSLFKLIFFFLKRFSFWEVMSILMLFGEVEQGKSSPSKIPIKLVYVDIVILVLLGTFLSFSKLWTRQVAVIAAVHLVFHSIFQASYYKTDRMVMLLVLLRYIGVLSGYLMIASGLGESSKAKRRKYIRASCFLFGLMFCGQAYFTGFVLSYHSIIRKFCPNTICSSTLINALIPIITVCLAACAFSFFTQSYLFKQLRHVGLLYAVVIMFPCDCLIITLPVAVQRWVWLRLVMSSIACVCGLTVISNIHL